MAARPFVLFGAAHMAALLATALAALALCLAVRRRPDGALAWALRVGLALLLLTGAAGYLLRTALDGTLTPWDLVPLHLCDFAIFLAAYALLTLHAPAGELLYFWAGSGTLLAMLTPDLEVGFPHWRFLAYFGLHGMVVIAAALLVFGLRRRPAPGAPWRALLWTNAYAALVGLVDAASGMNFLYLREKPAAPTLLDRLGPWPVYLLGAEVLALALFFLLDRPLRLATDRSR